MLVTGVNKALTPLLVAETGMGVAALQAWCQQGDGVSKWCVATSGLAHQGSLPGGGGSWAGPGRKGNTNFLRSPQLLKETEQNHSGVGGDGGQEDLRQ